MHMHELTNYIYIIFKKYKDGVARSTIYNLDSHALQYKCTCTVQRGSGVHEEFTSCMNSTDRERARAEVTRCTTITRCTCIIGISKGRPRLSIWVIPKYLSWCTDSRLLTVIIVIYVWNTISTHIAWCKN